MTAAELTAANLDRSAVLEEVIARAYGGDEAGLLGELQARCPRCRSGHRAASSCGVAGHCLWNCAEQRLESLINALIIVVVCYSREIWCASNCYVFARGTNEATMCCS